MRELAAGLYVAGMVAALAGDEAIADPLMAPAVLTLSAFAGLTIGSRWALLLPLASAGAAALATGAGSPPGAPLEAPVAWALAAALAQVALACGLALRGAVDQARE